MHLAPGPWHRHASGLAAGLLALLLQACGGGGDTPPAASAAPGPAVLSARVEGCGEAGLDDSGHVLYVRMSASCASPTPDAPRAVTLELGDSALTMARVPGAVDTSVARLPDLGERQVQLVQRGQWRRVPHLGTWQPRDGAGLLQLNGALYLLGGWLHGPVTNEVWRTVDLVQWEFLGYAPWPARHAAAWLVHDNRLWVIGGDLYDDVWSSPDGLQWTQEASAAPFGRRYTPNAASIGGQLVVYAGQDWLPVDWCHERPDCAARGLRSVWTSRDGRQWAQATPQAPWEGRALVHGSAVHEGRIWMIGGGLKVAPPGERYTETSAEFTDVWSSADGQDWRLEASHAGFTGRTHFSVLATRHGCFVSDGSVGTQLSVSNELFHASDCRRYSALPVPAGLPARHASSLVEFNGSLVLLGGPPYGGAGTQVWQYFP
jgi:hypothetical protein